MTPSQTPSSQDQQAEKWHGTAEVAVHCGITERQARNVCRSVLGSRTRYRLTDPEFERVCAWHAKWGYKLRR